MNRCALSDCRLRSDGAAKSCAHCRTCSPDLAVPFVNQEDQLEKKCSRKSSILLGNLGLTCLVRPDPRRVPARACSRSSASPPGSPCCSGRSSPSCSPPGSGSMPLGNGLRAYFYGSGDRRLERRLDHLLGPGAVQHARPHRPVRELPALADLAGHARHPGADDAVRLGLRRLARGPGRLRLSLGGGGADPDFAGADATWTPSASPPSPTTRRCPTARWARRSSRMAAVTGYPLLALSGSVGTIVAVPGAAAALGADLPRCRQGRIQGRLAARHRRIVWLHPRPVADRAFYFGPYLPDITGSIVCFCASAAAAEGLAAGPHPGSWRRCRSAPPRSGEGTERETMA